MALSKIFTIPQAITPANFEEVMQQVIALELATIPTYLSTYYSINRAQDQDVLYNKLQNQLAANSGYSTAEINNLAQELKVDILVYANKSAALIMSVAIEEMLHLALSSNVKQAIVAPPDLLSINKALIFPTQLDGHEPEFPINAAKLSLKQLSTFLQIESPAPFTDPADKGTVVGEVQQYQTIGQFYNDIIDFVQTHYNHSYPAKPQLLPPQKPAFKRPYYSQNTINTVYYDRNHNPQFGSADDQQDLIGVVDAASAIEAMQEIQHQGEGNIKDDQTRLIFDTKTGMPIPSPIIDGEVQFKKGDYDDATGTELSHFAKFMEIYSLGIYYQQKFEAVEGIDDFFSYFVRNQAANPKQADYDATGNNALSLCSQLGNAIFTYILLMIETCYYQDEHTQYDVFMYGVHKSMIWLLSGIGNSINTYSYTKEGQTYLASLTFEYFPFEKTPKQPPKAQILNLASQLALADPNNWGWITQFENASYWPALPDVRLDHKVVPNVPVIPA